MASIVLGYWDIRGRAEFIRTLLHYVGEEFEDKRYPFDVSDMNAEERIARSWFSEKRTAPFVIGGDGEQPMEFPNIPYYIETQPDGSKLKLTQSVAILKHIARRHGLAADSDPELVKLEMYEQQIADFRVVVVGYCYNRKTVVARYPNYLEDIKKDFEAWEGALQGKKWLMGDRLTYVDFQLFECLDWHIFMMKDCFEAYPNLKTYLERFRNLPRIAEYFASDRFKSWPLVSPFAPTFGFWR